MISEKVKEKKDILDSIKARDISSEIVKYGVNDNTIKKIINNLAIELEDRDTMLKIIDCLKNDNNEESINVNVSTPKIEI
jgi:hypothetical protein